jgi:phosphoadenosine phosphosulfate reductase
MSPHRIFPEYVTLDYDLGRAESAADYPTLEAQLERGIDVVRQALSQYDRSAVMWTGGKDSSPVRYLVQQVCAADGHPVPPVTSIDHHQHFQAVLDFVEHWAET